jgi:hypothetical protein
MSDQIKPRHSIESDALQNVLNYLQEKPFKEVSGLINGIITTAQPVAHGDASPLTAVPEEQVHE